MMSTRQKDAGAINSFCYALWVQGVFNAVIVIILNLPTGDKKKIHLLR